MLKAKDIMKKDVITVTPETSVEELGRLFIEKDISGAPVVDSGGNLYGIVTENDLISQNRKFHIPTLLRIFDAYISLDSDSRIEQEIGRLAATTVKEICSREVVTVAGETTLTDIATIMNDKKIHLLPVMKNGKIIGIIGKKEVIKGASAA